MALGGAPLAFEDQPDTGPPAMAIGGQSPQEAAKEARKSGRQQGLRGKQLKDVVKKARQSANQAQIDWATKALNLPPDTTKYVKRPKKFIKNLLAGKGPAFKKMALLRQASKDLGYTQAQDKMTGVVGQNIDPTTGQAIVDYHTEVTPEMQEWAKTVGAHIDPATGRVIGLTPDERNTFFNTLAQPIKTQAAGAYESEGQREAAAGIDPRSGIAGERARMIGTTEASQLAGAGQQTALEDIQRQRDWETHASNIAQLEESQRASEMAGDINKYGVVQTGLTNLAQLGENQRQFDVTYTEGQRQAAQRRADAKKAAEEATPSGMEKAAAGLSGLLGGLGMGGGGGGGGGMMSMMGGK